jgi:hypothetical protein
MADRRRFLTGSLAALLAPRATAATPPPDTADIDQLGKFERVLGRPGLVIGVPHGTADVGTLDVGRVLCERLGAGGVFVTGFWDPKTRQRINVNRDSEELIGQDSEVLKHWRSDRAIAANLRYIAMVQEASQGPLKVFFEIHSNHKTRYVDSVEVSTRGVWRGEAEKLKEAFEAARDRLAPDVPRLSIHVSPVDKVTFPNYDASSSIAKLSAKGCAIENPGRVFGHRPWRLAYAACLADAIKDAQWA